MIAALWLRPLWQRPGRALGTVAGVAVGVASVLSTALASRAAVASMTSDVEALAGAARLEVTRPGGVPLDDLALLRPIAGEAVIAPVIEGAAFVPRAPPDGDGDGGAHGGELVRLLGVDGLLGGGGAWTLEPGPAGADAARQAVLLGNGALLAHGNALGLAPGDTLHLVVRSQPIELEVAALFEPARTPRAWERVVVVDVALAQELLGELVDRLELTPRVPLDADALAALAAKATALLPDGYRVAPASARREEGERLTRSLAFNLTALSGVSVLVAIVLVATTLATSVVQRRALLSLLRSLGASRTQLGLAVVLEAAAIGLLGGAAGVALGAWIARGLAGDVHDTVTTIAEDALAGAVELTPAWIVAGVALGLGTALVAAVLPLREAWRTPPLQALRGEHPGGRRLSFRKRTLVFGLFLMGAAFAARQPAWNGRPVWALVSALFLLGTGLVLAEPLVAGLAELPSRWLSPRLAPPLRLAQAALAASRQRAAWAAGAVGVAVALAVSMHVMVGSFRTNVVDWTAQTLRADLQLRPPSTEAGVSAGRLAPEVLELAARVFGPECVDPYHETTATVLGQSVVLGGAAFPVVAREGGVPFLDGRESSAVFQEALARGEVVVNEPFERRFGLGRGARIAITSAGGTLERTIAGVYRDFSGHAGRVVMDLPDFLALHPDEGAETAAIFLPPGTDVEAVRARFQGELGGRWLVEVLNTRELRAEVLRVFERTFAVTIGLQVIASLVAGLAVVLVLSALVRERVRDLAVVRVLGGSRAQLGALVVGQGLLLGLAGALIGLAVGFVVGWLMVAVVNVQSFGWSLRFAPPTSVLWTVVAVLPACVAAGLVPAWLSWRAQPQEVLRQAD